MSTTTRTYILGAGVGFVAACFGAMASGVLLAITGDGWSFITERMTGWGMRLGLTSSRCAIGVTRLSRLSKGTAER